MHIPIQAAPVHRGTHASWTSTDARVRPQAPSNTCDCGGDQTYNQCGVTRNDCAPGYHPVCNAGAYNCGCTCTPG